jgi:hypothetical protein
LRSSRQWGKTSVAATKVVHLAVTRPGKTLIVFSKAAAFLERLDIQTYREPGKQMGRRLPNGFRIIGIAAREAAVRAVGGQASYNALRIMAQAVRKIDKNT